jgi:hypothetical protein
MKPEMTNKKLLFQIAHVSDVHIGPVDDTPCANVV